MGNGHARTVVVIDGGFYSLYSSFEPRINRLRLLDIRYAFRIPFLSFHADPTGRRGRTHIASFFANYPNPTNPQKPARPVKPLSLDRKGHFPLPRKSFPQIPTPSSQTPARPNLPPSSNPNPNPNQPRPIYLYLPSRNSSRIAFVPYSLQTVIRLRSTPSIPSHPIPSPPNPP